jgi:hypothetical protein
MSGWGEDRDPDDEIQEYWVSDVRRGKERSTWYGWLLGAGVAAVVAVTYNVIFG